jgi:hypothetical protein
MVGPPTDREPIVGQALHAACAGLQAILPDGETERPLD